MHFVNEKLDEGKIILKKFFYINDKEDIMSKFKKKNSKLEYLAFSEAIIKFLNNLFFKKKIYFYFSIFNESEP